MTAMELIAAARWGRLSRNDTVRRGKSSTWVPAERVKGLFNAPPRAGVVTSERLLAAAKKAAPARRSVHKTNSAHYWVKIDDKVSGPFTSGDLRQMAEQGALKPSYLISRDRQRWALAANVKGLAFGGAQADAATMSVRSAVWLDSPLASPPPSVPVYEGHALVEAG
jgi:hypothetical protein